MSAHVSNEAMKGNSGPNPIRVSATTIGVIFGLSGFNHGFFEYLQGNKPTDGLVIQAIGEGQRFWSLGTEEAFTVIPNFMISGLLSMVVGLIIVVWSLGFLGTKRGPTVFLILFVLLFLVGGGIGQIAFFVPAWAFAVRMNSSHEGWRKALPKHLRAQLASSWKPTLYLASALILIGLEVAIFGYIPGVTDPLRTQNIAMLLVFASALLYILAFIAGIAHELQQQANEAGLVSRDLNVCRERVNNKEVFDV